MIPSDSILIGAAKATPTTYISDATGSDAQSGTTRITAFATVAHVNTQPGDEHVGDLLFSYSEMVKDTLL